MKTAFGIGIALAVAVATVAAPTVAAAQERVQWAAPAPTTGRTAYLPMGTALQLTTRLELNTKQNATGDRFYLEVAEPVVYRGQVIIPAGAIAVGEIMRAERNGYFGKRGRLDIRLNYVQTPSGPVRISGRLARAGTGQELLSIGGALFVSWPMMFIHGTSGRVPADTSITAYLADDLRFSVQGDAPEVAAIAPDTVEHAQRTLPARFDPAVFSANNR